MEDHLRNSRIPGTTGEFYLAIAKQELEALNACPAPVAIEERGYSEHFRHAVVCSVFAAFAVEHAMTELVWFRCFYQTDEPYRRISMLHAATLRTTPARLGFLRETTGLSKELLLDLEKLFDYRNRIAHCRAQPIPGGQVVGLDEVLDALGAEGKQKYLAKLEAGFVDKTEMLEQLLSSQWVRDDFLVLPGFSAEDVDAAATNYEIAERALEALDTEMLAEPWSPVGSFRKPKRVRRRPRGRMRSE